MIRGGVVCKLQWVWGVWAWLGRCHAQTGEPAGRGIGACGGLSVRNRGRKMEIMTLTIGGPCEHHDVVAFKKVWIS